MSMLVRDGVAVAVLVTFVLAAAAALTADRPPARRHRRWRWWRFERLIVVLSVANIGLSVAVAARPAPVAGTTLLGSALLLVYAAHRRARAMRMGPRPGGRRR
ncbi:hypothetical protein [Dactylosporangium sp. NPDC048998]|uniref:hypothetical protein n=1 Tax=Dactylosporangium sp. NPDC048998 TaxID=3363976 RepID=UPI00371BF529